MGSDTITLGLDGEVQLADFAGALQRLSGLVDALSQEVAGDESISWLAISLEAGSAVATFRGEAADVSRVERVVSAYLNVGRAMETGSPFPYSDRVREQANGITSYLNGKITAIQFANDTDTAVVMSRSEIGEPAPKPDRSLGVLTGRIETPSRRQGLKFTLYDDLFDRAVTCYLSPGQEELVRHSWGKHVRVSGTVVRDYGSGRPLHMRDVVSVDVLPPKERHSYRRARGVLTYSRGGKPEEVVRRARDA